MNQVARALVRLSNTPDGKVVLNYLTQTITNRVLAPQASNQELWYLEGQRAFIATLHHLIQQGKQP